MDRPVVYVAGPMSGHKDFNYPAFHAAAAAWKESGYEVLNPADNSTGIDVYSTPYDYFIRKGIEQVLRAEAIALLPGWQKSRGARLELDIARSLGLPVYDAVTMERYGADGTATFANFASSRHDLFACAADCPDAHEVVP